jgi:hypothetical protein
MSSLIGEDNILKPMVDPDLAATFAQAWNYDKGRNCNPCCEIPHFRIDLLGPPRGPWNKSASKVFSGDFIRHHGLKSTTEMIDNIENVFHTRVKTLKEKSKRHHLRPSELHQEVHGDRRCERKYLVITTSVVVIDVVSLTLFFHSYSRGDLTLHRCTHNCKSISLSSSS